MQAYNKYLVIEEDKEKTKITKGGLELSEKHTTDIKFVEGTVISTGTTVEGVKDKDRILYRKLSGHGVEIDDVFYKVILESDIMMIL